MTLQQLLYFREVAQTLNFTKASRNLHITQSALSASIIALERELELPLFIRKSGKGLELTSYGIRLLPMSEDTLSSMDRLEKNMRSIRNPKAGVVNIAFSYINCWRFIPGMLQGFREEVPENDIALNLSINHSKRNFEEEILRGDVDIAFSCMESMEGLTSVPFARQQLYVAVSTQHELADRTYVTIEDIKDERLIGYYRGRNLDRWIRKMFDRAGYHPATMDYVEDWSIQVTRVSIGEGIAIMPLVPTAEGMVCFLPLRGDMGIRTVYMMWAAGGKLTPAVEFARDYFLDYGESIGLV